ncbi:MAG: amino acid-binding protein [Zetaproteobacteria bacterium]|nr:MAG: amino acid-binding protein [Zetaproteobacteria bacterium]
MPRHMLLTISGADRRGIVRDVAGAMAHLEINVEDSSMTALRGAFTIMMIVRLPEGLGIASLKAALADLEQRTGLTVHARPLDAEEAARDAPGPDCVVTVTGGDRPGIVHAVAEAIADGNGSIVDLSTSTVRLDEDSTEEHYIMALEVACDDCAGLKRRLGPVADALGVDIEVIAMEEELL